MITILSGRPECSAEGMVPSFWPKVVLTESSYDPLTLHDDSVNRPFGRSYYPPTMDEAERIATELMSQGHSVGVGLSQLTAKSPAEFLSRFGLTIREALEPCRNMHAGAQWYVAGKLSIYNSGSPTRGLTYAQRVMARVGGDPPPIDKPSEPPACPVDDTDGWHTSPTPAACQPKDDTHEDP